MVTLHAPRFRPPRRTDESMSLLNDLFERPLDPGYEEAAARRAEGESAETQSRFSPALVCGMVALGLLLTMAALQVRDTAAVVSSERESLIERIRAEDDRVSQLEGDVAALEADIGRLEDSLLEDSAAGQAFREDVQRLQASAGSIPVTGPGIVVTLDNAEGPDDADDPELSRVLAIDLQQVVNGLWAAGAEAVSVNGQRVTGLTAIRQVDNVVKINYRPTNPPFEIIAIGDSRSLPNRFGDGSGGQWLRHVASNNGLRFDVRSEDSLTVPAGNTPLMYARPGEVT